MSLGRKLALRHFNTRGSGVVGSPSSEVTLTYVGTVRNDTSDSFTFNPSGSGLKSYLALYGGQTGVVSSFVMSGGQKIFPIDSASAHPTQGDEVRAALVIMKAGVSQTIQAYQTNTFFRGTMALYEVENIDYSSIGSVALLGSSVESSQTLTLAGNGGALVGVGFGQGSVSGAGLTGFDTDDSATALVEDDFYSNVQSSTGKASGNHSITMDINATNVTRGGLLGVALDYKAESTTAVSASFVSATTQAADTGTTTVDTGATKTTTFLICVAGQWNTKPSFGTLDGTSITELGNHASGTFENAIWGIVTISAGGNKSLVINEGLSYRYRIFLWDVSNFAGVKYSMRHQQQSESAISVGVLDGAYTFAVGLVQGSTSGTGITWTGSTENSASTTMENDFYAVANSKAISGATDQSIAIDVNATNTDRALLSVFVALPDS